MADGGYQDAMLRRLGIIGSMGEQANNLAAQPHYGTPPASMPGGGNGVQDGGGGGFQSFMDAIRQHESSGRYGVVNPDSGALGAYQVMPGNLPSWSKEALGHSVSSQQYLQSKQLQDQIAGHMLSQYYNKWGPGGAAVAWYAGPGRVDGWMKSGGNSPFYKAPQGNYSSISSYALSILRAMGLG
jgi:hypothetical protein